MNPKKKLLKNSIAIEAAAVQIEAAETEGAPPSFSVVAYTGGALDVKGYDRPVVVDLEGLGFRNSLVANLDHDPKQRVGHVTEKSREGGELRLSGVASAVTPARTEVVESAISGFQWQASIEAMPRKLETVPKGRAVSVNGQNFTGPLYVARHSTLKGFAFVSHGADDDTSVEIAAAESEERVMDSKLKTWIEAMGFDPDELTDEQVKGLTSNYEGRTAPQPEPKKVEAAADDLEAILAKQREEKERQDALNKITAGYLHEYPEQIEAIEALARLSRDNNWDKDQYELELLRATRPQTHARQTLRDGGKSNQKVIECALARTGGLESLEEKYDEQTLEAADRMFPSGIGLQELFVIAARENGCHQVSAKSNMREVMEFAFQPQNRQINAMGFSTLSLPGILSNTANKFLWEGWNYVDPAWRSVSSRRSARDFKEMSTYSLTGDFKYRIIPGDGEIKHADAGEELYGNKVDTYARMFAITRQDIINDDLGALTSVPRRLGRGAGLAMNEIFWTEFLDNATFYTLARGNYQEGANTALDSQSLSDAEVLFQEQTDPDGHPLGVMPAILLVPPGLRTPARELMNSQLLITGDTITRPDINIWRNEYTVVSTPYLSNAAIGGSSAVAWYLLANPNEMSVIEVAFLNGRDMPVVESADANFNTLGVQMRGYHDFGVRKQEYRGGVKSKGEA